MNRRTLLTALAAALCAPLSWLLKIEPPAISGTRSRRRGLVLKYGPYSLGDDNDELGLTVMPDISGPINITHRYQFTIKKTRMPFNWPNELV